MAKQGELGTQLKGGGSDLALTKGDPSSYTVTSPLCSPPWGNSSRGSQFTGPGLCGEGACLPSPLSVRPALHLVQTRPVFPASQGGDTRASPRWQMGRRRLQRLPPCSRSHSRAWALEDVLPAPVSGPTARGRQAAVFSHRRRSIGRGVGVGGNPQEAWSKMAGLPPLASATLAA